MVVITKFSSPGFGEEILTSRKGDEVLVVRLDRHLKNSRPTKRRDLSGEQLD